jgi:ATP-dependent Zn protease
MNKEVLEALISWFPMLLLIGVWIFFMKKMQGNLRSASGKSPAQVAEEQLSEMRRQNDLLEKILTKQDARLQALENAEARNAR